MAAIGTTPAVYSWGVKDDSWTVLQKEGTCYHRHIPSGKLFEASNSVKEVFTAALFTYAAPYFFCAQAVTHAVYGAFLIGQIKGTRKDQEGRILAQAPLEKDYNQAFSKVGKMFLAQAGMEFAFSATLWMLGWYSWVPSAILLAYSPLLFRVHLNYIEDFLAGKKEIFGFAKINELGWKSVLPALANNSLRLSDLFGMGEVPNVPATSPDKTKEE